MNILPLVSAFILIFSIGSLALLRHCKAAFIENKDSHVVYLLQREMYNEYAFNEYKELGEQEEKEKKDKDPNTSSGERNNVYKFPRGKIPPSNYGKLNIATLRSANSNSHLRGIALKLIKNMYEFTSVYFEDMEEIILKHIIETAKAHPKLTAFEDLYMYIPEAQRDFFYKIFNGTQSYQLCTSEGYPPLRDFLIIGDKTDHKPIHILKASEMVLNAVFDEAITRKIVHAEHLNWEKNGKKEKKFLKDEMIAFLLKEGVDLANFGQDLFSFSDSSKGNKDRIYKDKNSKKQIRRNQK